MSDIDWTTDEYLANIAAEELRLAMTETGIRTNEVSSTGDGRVFIRFPGLPEAEALLSLATPQSEATGSLYDRATSSCLTLTAMQDAYENMTSEAADKAAAAAMDAGWTWLIHPDLKGRSVRWHVMVDIPHQDANAVTAILNTLRHGGAL